MKQDVKWAADKVVQRPIDELKAYEHNARTHDAGQISKLADSIREYGWTIPVLVDEEGTILAGHGRVEAAKFLRMTHVPVMVATGWDEKKKRAYVFADNRLAEMSDWNSEILVAEIKSLMEGDFGISTLGFNLPDLQSMLAEPTQLEQVAKLRSGIDSKKKNEAIRFDQYMVPLSDDEYAWLEARLQYHRNLYGANIDFVTRTLNAPR